MMPGFLVEVSFLLKDVRLVCSKLQNHFPHIVTAPATDNISSSIYKI